MHVHEVKMQLFNVRQKCNPIYTHIHVHINTCVRHTGACASLAKSIYRSVIILKAQTGEVNNVDYLVITAPAKRIRYLRQ